MLTTDTLTVRVIIEGYSLPIGALVTGFLLILIYTAFVLSDIRRDLQRRRRPTSEEERHG